MECCTELVDGQYQVRAKLIVCLCEYPCVNAHHCVTLIAIVSTIAQPPDECPQSKCKRYGSVIACVNVCVAMMICGLVYFWAIFSWIQSKIDANTEFRVHRGLAAIEVGVPTMILDLVGLVLCLQGEYVGPGQMPK